MLQYVISVIFLQEVLFLLQSCQLFISVALDSAGIDYHVVLAQNALQQCLDVPELQAELMCALVKQTSRHTQHKIGVQVNRTITKFKHSRVSVVAASPACTPFFVFVLVLLHGREGRCTKTEIPVNAIYRTVFT